MHAVTEININNGVRIGSLADEKLSYYLIYIEYKNKQN